MIYNRKETFERITYHMIRSFPDGRRYGVSKSFSHLEPRYVIAQELRRARRELQQYRALLVGVAV